MSKTGTFKLLSPDNLIPLALALSGLYWFYLAFISQMIITSDAIGYETLGKMFHQKGLLEYFKTGPNREPLYPLLISLSMRLADMLHVPYQSIQKSLQGLILLTTQLLTLRILNKLNIGHCLKFFCLLYIGFSPALVNSAFSLYSEIAAYPFVLLIVLLTAQIWPAVLNKTTTRIPFYTVGLILACLGVINIKAAFIYILAITFFPYLLHSVKLCVKTKKMGYPAGWAMLILYGAVAIFPLAMAGLNQKYNGHFTFTDRGDRAFYVAAALRTEGINQENLSYALRIQPHLEFSQKGEDLFTLERIKLQDQGFSAHRIDTEIYRVGIQKILQNPLSYLFFYVLQVAKMFFWETTHIGFVAYPGWLTALFDCRPLEITLHLISGLLALTSLFYVIFLLQSDGMPDEHRILLSAMIMLIIPFTLFYSFSIVLPRFLLPITPLYIIITAFFLNNIFRDNKT